MKTKYPIKKISILNLWLTSYFVLFGFVFTMINEAEISQAITHALLGGIILFINTFTNLALLIFLENRLVINKSIHRRNYLLLSYASSYGAYLTVVFCYTMILDKPVLMKTFIYTGFFCILTNTLILALQNYVVLQDAKMSSDMENSQLKIANADAANQLLRQQIQPHFLFNTLNILKSLYKINPKAGEEYLIRLSDFLRAAVSNNNIKIIPLKDEMKLCEDYLAMQKIRFGRALLCSVSILDETLQKGFIPSFSLQPLLENAIKHNELTEESPLHIQVLQEGERIKVINNLKLKATTETSTGSGLANLSERYRLLANDELIIENSRDTFSVSIKILYHEDSNHRG